MKLITELEGLDDSDFTGKSDWERSNRQLGAPREPASSATVAPLTETEPLPSSSSTQHPVTHPSSPSDNISRSRPTPSLSSELRKKKYPPSIIAAVERAEAAGSPIVLDPLDEFPPTRLKPSKTEENRADRVKLWKDMRWMRKNETYMEEARKALPFEYTLGPPPCESDDEDDGEEDHDVDALPSQTLQASVEANVPGPVTATATSSAGSSVPSESNVHTVPATNDPNPPSRPVSPAHGHPPALPARPMISFDRSAALTPRLSSVSCPTVPADHPCLVNPHPIYSFQQCEGAREKEFYVGIFSYLQHTGHGPLFGALVSRFFIYEEACGFEVRQYVCTISSSYH